MKKLLLAVLCLSGTALFCSSFGATPVAVWDGADSDYNFSSLTRGIFTLSANGNTVATDYSSFTISDDSYGVVFTGTNSSINATTIIVRGSGLDLNSTTNQYLLCLSLNASTSTVSAANYNRVGVYMEPNNGGFGCIWNSGRGYTTGDTNTQFSTGNDFVFRHDKSNGATYAGTYVGEISEDESGSRTLTQKFYASGLKGNSDAYLGFLLGGQYSSSAYTNGYVSAKNWNVTKIAIFDSALSDDEIVAYAFPSEIQTLDVSADTTVSAINELTTSGVRELTLNVSDGVTITNDTTFSAESVVVSSTGSVNFYAASQPSDVDKIDVSAVEGNVIRSWFDPGIIGMNFNTNGVRSGTSYGSTDDTSGALASGGTWYGDASSASGTLVISDDGLTKVTWSSKLLYTTATSGLSTFMQGYLDDGNNVSINVTGIPYDTYDVIIYCATDDSSKAFKAKVVNDTSYIWDSENSTAASSTNGVEITATDTWGSANVAVGAAVLGSNALRVNGLTGALSISGGTNGNSARGCIAAIQIMPTGEGQSWALSLAENATVNWSTATWTGATTEQAYPTNEMVTITLAGDATLTIDTVDGVTYELPQITLAGTGTLTLVQNGATIDKIISTGPSITATSLEVSTMLEAALVIPSDGLTITVPEGASLTQTGVISGDYALTKAGAGTLTDGSANTFTGGLVVNAGTMKTTSSTGYGPYTANATVDNLSKITVNSGATLDLAATSGYCYDITSAGGTIVNTGTAMGTNARQMTRLTLTADSTVGGTSRFGLLGSNFASTYLNLAGHTLTKTNSNDFLLYNTTIAGDSGTIQIDEGTVTLYGTCSFSGTTIQINEGTMTLYGTSSFTDSTVSIGADGTLVYGSASVSGLSVTGSGTVNLGTYRPSNTITFAEGNSVTLSLTLTNTTDTTVSIPYSGAVPSAIQVYESDGTNVISSSSIFVDSSNSTLTLTIPYMDALTYTNPVLSSDSATFTYAFTNLVSSDWADTDNWYQVTDNRYVPYTANTTSPYVNGNRAPLVFDGKAGVTSSTSFEAYNLRIGLFNGSDVTIPVTKFQQGSTVASWVMVDETSKLTVSNANTTTTFGNTSGIHTFYVAAKEGLEFQFDFPSADSQTVGYYLKGDGSVKYTGSLAGSHSIGMVVLDAYLEQQDTELPFGLVKGHPLVTYGSLNSPTITTSGADVRFDNSSSGTAGTASDTALTLSDAASKSNAGKYYIYSDTTGIYIDYIGYAADALTPGIRVYVR